MTSMAASDFEISCGKKDRQTNVGKNPTPPLSSTWVIKMCKDAQYG